MTLGARLGIATATLSIVGSIVGSTLWLAKKFSDQDARIAKLESAIKVLNSTQDEKYQQLVKDLLAKEHLPTTPTVHRFGMPPAVDSDAAPAADAPRVQRPIP